MITVEIVAWQMITAAGAVGEHEASRRESAYLD
jgi:hypothetical protein